MPITWVTLVIRPCTDPGDTYTDPGNRFTDPVRALTLVICTCILTLMMDIQTCVILTLTLVISSAIGTLVMDILTMVMGMQTQGCQKGLTALLNETTKPPKKQHFHKICSLELTRHIHRLETTLRCSIFNERPYCFVLFFFFKYYPPIPILCMRFLEKHLTDFNNFSRDD